MDDNTLYLSIIVLYFAYRIVMTWMKRRTGTANSGTVETEAPASEAELLRELHHGLVRMEKRIEALETLLAERDEVERAAANQKPR